MSDPHNLYIHVYTMLDQETVLYRDPQEEDPIGQNLLKFIYSDVSDLSYEEMQQENGERIAALHPYFRHIPKEALLLLFENSIDLDYRGNYSFEGIARLQDQYKKWLTLYACDGFSRKLFGQIEGSRLYTQSHFTMLCNRPALDFFLLGFEDCLSLEFFELIRRQKRVKICKNCQKLFLPQKGNIDYCNRIYTPDQRTCQEVGYSQTFARSVKQDDLLQAYTRAYKAHYARMSKPRKHAANLSREEFHAWYQEAKEKLELARQGLLDADEYKEWLKK